MHFTTLKYNTWNLQKWFDESPPLDVRGILLDISKTFDKVWDNGLVYKLKPCGISGKLTKAIENYLTVRKKRVVFNC